MTPAVVAVTGITLDNAAASVEAGKTTKLTATITPENATDTGVTWASSDTKIATVKDGTVTGVAAGTATITASSHADSKKTATSEITVTAAAESK